MSDSYRGRFAPSPTGPLHFGSLLTAVGSYLQAKHHNGKWLLRIDDLDPPREVPGASDNIRRTLEKFGLYWDEDVCYQSQQAPGYQAALEQLKQKNLLYPCDCSRKTIQNQGAIPGKIGLVYPGRCRHRNDILWENKAIRIRVLNKKQCMTDLLQGQLVQDLAKEVGDICLKRADGLFSYHIASVVDDNLQGITEVVRGFDLLQCSPIQIYLQQCLNYTTPTYAHLPIVVNEHNEKLSKQTIAESVESREPATLLFDILRLLKQNPPGSLINATRDEILNWAIENWNLTACKMQTIKLKPSRQANENRSII
ncbi:MAG TPA: tRNA glutamyl-Q(34) synthetase GluQRS [Gammaproteobacteria bacterium]|nr:tRNA glutamyl-Q(34) synthetase GluQRS [Gammaproteobacteria bacterium]